MYIDLMVANVVRSVEMQGVRANEVVCLVLGTPVEPSAAQRIPVVAV